MVRKPVNSVRVPAAPVTPYPITPTSPIERNPKLPASLGGLQSQGLPERATGGVNTPDLADGLRHPYGSTMSREQPPPLRLGEGFAGNDIIHSNGGLPPTLQIGSADATPRTSSESQRSNGSARHNRANTTSQSIPQRQRSSSSNPFRRNYDHNGKAPDRHNYGGESSADVWGDGPKIETRDAFTEPWMVFEKLPEQEFPPQLASGLAQGNIRQIHEPATNQSRIANEHMRPYQQALQFESQAAEAPEVDVRSSENQDIRLSRMPDGGEKLADPSYNVWDDARQTPAFINPTPLNDSHVQSITLESPPSLLQPERPPPQPPRPPKALDDSPNAAFKPEVQITRDESMKSKRAGETYQIRLVNWYDASSPTNPRRSPIMVQNANGPCPLLALVNALVLTTPSDITTALVETLRVREQVSLGLLLDAVIDELMSGRRRGSSGILPDVSELYAFLVTLHTGMNVNPRFVPSENSAVNLMDAPIDIPTSLHESRRAGGFEDTREMRLYSTFSIPLIHGWIPPRNHPAFAALKHTAETYEDAQNIMFREEELEEKYRRQGLGPEEQLILEDIASVKYFLSSTATQLTGYGLDTVTETLGPGSVAILFRNDHFSTLYRHPKSGQLLTLVTDMGYVGHDEVVWQSLVDVSGEGCEFFAGDFRPVGNVAGDAQQQPTSNPAEDDSGWTTVSNRTRRGQPSRSNSGLPALNTLDINDNHPPVVSANTEQEDHDLALAMQLQEEEEERERQEAAKRKRDDELSQAYLNSADSQGRRTFPGFGRGAGASGGGPSPPPRGRGSARQAPTKAANDDEDAPPPTYEQAANGPAYIPPSNYPVHPQASPSPGGSMPRPGPTSATRPRQSSSAYSEHAASYGHSPSYGPARRGHIPRSSASGTGRGGGIGGVEGAPGAIRRRSGAPGSAVSLEGDKKDKDCNVM